MHEGESVGYPLAVRRDTGVEVSVGRGEVDGVEEVSSTGTTDVRGEVPVGSGPR